MISEFSLKNSFGILDQIPKYFFDQKPNFAAFEERFIMSLCRTGPPNFVWINKSLKVWKSLITIQIWFGLIWQQTEFENISLRVFDLDANENICSD